MITGGIDLSVNAIAIWLVLPPFLFDQYGPAGSTPETITLAIY
jgi:ribose/xylose/arabinose/galactoside ABC-type transport system permease subunit